MQRGQGAAFTFALYDFKHKRTLHRKSHSSLKRDKLSLDNCGFFLNVKMVQQCIKTMKIFSTSLFLFFFSGGGGRRGKLDGLGEGREVQSKFSLGPLIHPRIDTVVLYELPLNSDFKFWAYEIRRKAHLRGLFSE